MPLWMGWRILLSFCCLPEITTTLLIPSILWAKQILQAATCLGDKAYGTKEILAYINEHGATVVIPPKSNAKDPWPVDYCLYEERHLAECFFQKIKPKINVKSSTTF